MKFDLVHLTKYIVNYLKCGFQVKVTFVANNREADLEEKQTHFAYAVICSCPCWWVTLGPMFCFYYAFLKADGFKIHCTFQFLP